MVAQLAELRPVHEAFAWFRAHARELEDIQLEVTAIAAPPWGEAARAEWLRERFAGLGLTEVHLDELGNVFGIHPGADTKAPFLALSAHIDTVFPAGTPITVAVGKQVLPEAGIRTTARASRHCWRWRASDGHEHANSAPILFIGNVGEEGEGNLRGMRHIFQQPRWLDSIGALVVLDGAGTDTIIAEGLGSRRYEITVHGPGGHSWSDFGVANPIVALARIIDRFSQTTVPATPKTTFNVGVVEGGTSVNSIPQSATIRVDTRSASVEQLDRLEKALRDAVKEGAAHAAGRKKQEALTAEVRVIG